MLRKYIVRYLLVCGVLVNAGVVTALSTAIYQLYQSDIGFDTVVFHTADNIEKHVPSVAKKIRGFVQASEQKYLFNSAELENWVGEAGVRFPYVKLDESVIPTRGRSIRVFSAKQFRQALRNAKPGDVITLAKGIYRFDSKLISIGKQGLPDKPIRVKADRLGDVILRLDTLEGFYVNQPYWGFENLTIEGVCKYDSRCEHAFHVVGDGHHFVLKNNIITEFNAAIKVNGTRVNGHRVYPDFGRVEYNNIFNRRVRDTANPVTVIDIIAVNNWIVKKNFIADFVKGKGNKISYAGFFKGGGSDNVFEQNFVACRFNLNNHSGVQVGLSFGGGGSSQSACRDGVCDGEHYRGTIRNNVIANCNDVAVYLNKSSETEIYNNTLINTLGIDIRYPQSSAVIANNMLTGRIKNRNFGSSEEYANLIFDMDDLGDYFLDPSVGDMSIVGGDEILLKGVPTVKDKFDFCGNEKISGAIDIGAIQYSANGELCKLF